MKKAKNKPVKEKADKIESEKIEIKTPKENPLLIEWQAPEFEYREKDVSWYWMGLIIAFCLLALAVWQKNFLFAVFTVIAYLVVVYSGGQKPAVWKFTINDKGVEIDPQRGKSIASRFYKYEEIIGFDIWEKELVLRTNKKISPYLKMIFPKEKEKEIKEFLAKYIPEEEYNVSIADSFSKLVGF
ncbi:MAG: hypothetical protein WC461_00135 [Candidatus Paceibacterota bacterium]